MLISVKHWMFVTAAFRLAARATHSLATKSRTSSRARRIPDSGQKMVTTAPDALAVAAVLDTAGKMMPLNALTIVVASPLVLPGALRVTYVRYARVPAGAVTQPPL